MAAQVAVADQWGDQWWRLCNVYYIKTKNGRKVKLYPNEEQERLYRSLWYNSIILKSRQIGFSTFIQVLMLDSAFWTPTYDCISVSYNLDEAREAFDRNIKFPYDNLPDGLREANPARNDAANMLKFDNRSSVRTTASGRGATAQFVHISEFGKICAKYPAKAREIVTGTLETVGDGNLRVIESTAEGRQGRFYEMTMSAKGAADARRKLTRQGWRLHFYAWWQHANYALPPDEAALVPISDELARYFTDLERTIGQKLTPGQKAFYAQKNEALSDDVYREYPSTVEEAFLASMKGTYYAERIAALRKSGRITAVPIEPSVPINTAWDLGVDDYTAIWLHQRVGLQDRLVDYIEGTDQDIQSYVNKLFEYSRAGYVFGMHLLPHDARNRQLALPGAISMRQHIESLGVRPTKIIDTKDLLAGIQQTRNFLKNVHIDEKRCAKGIERLEHYKRDWSEKLADYLDKPLHDENSHGADALRILATGYDDPVGESDEPEAPADY